MTAAKIKPCPFCRSKNVKVWLYGTEKISHGHAVACEDCEAQGPVTLREVEAVRIWNDVMRGTGQ